VPGETALIVAAAYAGHTHRLSVWVIFVLALVAAVLGGYLGDTPARNGDSSCELVASARSPRSPRNWCDRRAAIWPEQGSGMRSCLGTSSRADRARSWSGKTMAAASPASVP